MKLHELTPAASTNKAPKRVGRGVGSGWGKTAGRGSKGSKARSGGSIRPGYEGGQMPLQRRLPKRGFTNIFAKRYAVVNVRDLSRFAGDKVVDEAALAAAGLVKGRRDGVKLLGNGDVDRPLEVRVNLISRSARAKIEAAGGKVEVIE